MRRRVLLIAAVLAVPAALLHAQPMTLTVTKRIDLGPARSKGLAYNRWNRMVVTTDGRLAAFYVTDKGLIAYRLTADGRTFAKPVVCGEGHSPAVALDAEDNLYVAWRGWNGKIALRICPRKGEGWDVSAKQTAPFARFGDGQQLYPTILILPNSKRIWFIYSYQRVDYRVGKKDRRKPRSQPLLTYSDDGGKRWAEPVYVGSDSGDIGTGIHGLRRFRGRPAFFWAFWDCAPPAWGYFDGSHVRGLREIFPHTKFRTSCWHVWDTAETADGRLWFATGLDYQTRGQIFKTFDGSKWTKDVLLNNTFGRTILLTDGKLVFCAAADGGPRKTHARRLSLYQLAVESAVRRPVMYTTPEGREIFRLYPLSEQRKPEGYFPILMIEEKAGVKGEDQRLVFLRAEVEELSRDAAAKAATPLVNLNEMDDAERRKFVPWPMDDPRKEPRTDVSKDRKIVRVGEKWVLVYADDNPGRLLAAPFEADGTLGKPIVLVDEPMWRRFQCAAVADGSDALAVVCGGGGQVLFVRVKGIADWANTPPRITVRQPLGEGLNGDPWPSICLAGETLFVTFQNGDTRVTRHSMNLSRTGWVSRESKLTLRDPRAALLVRRHEAMLITGHADGIDVAQWKRTPWGRMQMVGHWKPAQRVVGEPHVGQHFSATSHEGRIDLLYSAAESYQGAKALRHISFDGEAWSTPTDVDAGRRIRGMSLSSLGDGKLLCVYAVRNPRPAEAPQYVEKLERFTYTLVQKVYDGGKWQAAPTEIVWPEVKDHRPVRWDPSMVDFTQIRNWQGLIGAVQQQVKADTPSPGKQIWKLAKPETREAFGKLSADRKPSRAEHGAVTDILSTAVGGRQLYSAQAWAGVELPAEAKALLGRDFDTLSPSMQRRLNRLLLDAAYPAFLRPGRTWRQLTGNRGYVVTYARELGVFPTLPAAVPAGSKAVPAAWMVPGFACITRYWLPSDRGGILVSALVQPAP